MTVWAFLAASYLLGAIPSSYIAGRLGRGIDLRRHGSGNLGSTNAFRVLGARVAAPVVVFDILKGWAPVALFPAWDGAAEWSWALAYGAAAIFGHVFSVFVMFRGGKGVATGAGVFLALSPIAVGAAILVWLVVLWRSRMASLASVAAAVALIVAVMALEPRVEVRGLGIAVAVFVIFAHRENIGRIRRGEEQRFGSARTPHTSDVEQPL